MSVLSDPKLQYALPMENEIRLTYPFANLHFTFPTKPYNDNEIYFPSYLKKITDTVSPEYTPTHVFGRSDPVATYKKTSRKIYIDKEFVFETRDDCFIYRDGRVKCGNYYVRIYDALAKKEFSKSLRTNNRHQALVAAEVLY